ncbi:DNA adenine methylase [Burkholderia sp. Ac-20379]|uniref:DNA adenine methylase n=1 Tax=Burkholderia sp. Ac-20379 TaxID=2703900 RepID=UPI001F119EC0|nr:DNA adenine methylase [Burkholderia sp. Ac-20379]
MAKPIIPRIGSKRRLATPLLPRFPAHKTYVEVFAGGAALFFMRPPAKVEVINDVNGELVNFYRVVQHHLEEFVHQFKWALTSRHVFEWLKATAPEALTDIQRGAQFDYLQKSCFGGKIEGQTFGTATTICCRASAASTIAISKVAKSVGAAGQGTCKSVPHIVHIRKVKVRRARIEMSACGTLRNFQLHARVQFGGHVALRCGEVMVSKLLPLGDTLLNFLLSVDLKYYAATILRKQFPLLGKF